MNTFGVIATYTPVEEDEEEEEEEEEKQQEEENNWVSKSLTVREHIWSYSNLHPSRRR